MSTPERQELIKNAVIFLSDFNTQQAPLAQRVQFLEAKGLTGPEIEEAMRRAAGQTSQSQSSPPPQTPCQPYSVYGPSPYGPMQPQPWDWRDYFKYMLPHLKPPAATAYEQDRDALTTQFDAAEALLKEIQAETASVRAAVEEQNEKVDKATKDVESVVVEMREGEARTRDEMREIRDEVENIREMLPKMIEKNKEAQKQSLSELQQELKSLKTILLSRGSGTLPSAPPTPLPGLAGRPSIPAWQLAGTSPAASSESLPTVGLRTAALANIHCTHSRSTMFSQFRQAVETFVQESTQTSSETHPGARSRSTEGGMSHSPQSSSHLTESALFNLRKSLAAQRAGGATPQRPGSPQARSTSPVPSSVPRANVDSGLRKSTLEERLRASFTIGDSSGGTTPNPVESLRASPVPDAAHSSQGYSPESTPLPESPTQVAHDTPPTEDPVSALSNPSPPVLPENEHPSSPDSPLINALGDVSGNAGQDACVPVQEDMVPLSHTTQAIHPSDAVSTDDSFPASDGNNAAEITAPPPPDSGVAVPILDEQMVPTNSRNADVEALQERLKLVEQRFADVSTSFKKLQAERLAVDGVMRELTPLEDVKDVTAVRDYLTNVNMKVELGQDELQHLNGKLTRQEEYIAELQDKHRQEMASQSDQIEKLKQQLIESEALISASQASSSQSEEEEAKRKAEIEQLTTEAAKAKEFAKEEEEKRVKAVSLLKTVRQKLVKAEKERDDALKDLNELKEKDRQERERDKSEKAKLQSEIDAVNLERERAVAGLRAQFEKELAATKDKAEMDISSTRLHFNTEMDMLKASHSKELATRDSRISTLENSVNRLSGENKSLFDELQLRQAELESSQLHSETLQSQCTELQFQLRETQERAALLVDELGDLRSEQEVRLQGSGSSTEEVSQLISSVETKYETRLAELRKTLATIEKDRTESEANWSSKLLNKTKEVEELRRLLQTSTLSREQEEDVIGSLKTVIEKLKGEVQLRQTHLSEVQSVVDKIKANETLRDELRKVQNSVTLLERQRNPGVGYWTSRTGAVDSRTSVSSASDTPSRAASPEPPTAAATTTRSDEDINYEYLRNVILQFLEHKEMRPNLIRVLSTILRFTPQETRRLIAKV
ncbi:hypothetical protein ID866_4796 [Astraeus odoratus]|nr:hypothetical protein ID866_4796 [Astraeus odoratus]